LQSIRFGSRASESMELIHVAANQRMQPQSGRFHPHRPRHRAHAVKHASRHWLASVRTGDPVDELSLLDDELLLSGLTRELADDTAHGSTKGSVAVAAALNRVSSRSACWAATPVVHTFLPLVPGSGVYLGRTRHAHMDPWPVPEFGCHRCLRIGLANNIMLLLFISKCSFTTLLMQGIAACTPSQGI